MKSFLDIKAMALELLDERDCYRFQYASQSLWTTANDCFVASFPLEE